MSEKLIKYGVFWKPSEKITDFIAYWKNRVSRVEPDADYLKHPVHCTLYLLMAKKSDEVLLIKKMEKICSQIHAFELSFSGWIVFENDAITNADTLVLKIKLNKQLLELQRKIVEEMSLYRQSDVICDVNWQAEYLESMKKWGYPFVGSHWIPHISVASVKNAGKICIDEALNLHDFPSIDLIGSLSLYTIENDRHDCLKTINLKGRL